MSRCREDSDTKFDKQTILRSRQFTGTEKDFLRALLAEDGRYTLEQVREFLQITLQKEV